jgi:hypothetical protein
MSRHGSDSSATLQKQLVPLAHTVFMYWHTLEVLESGGHFPAKMLLYSYAT